MQFSNSKAIANPLKAFSFRLRKDICFLLNCFVELAQIKVQSSHTRQIALPHATTLAFTIRSYLLICDCLNHAVGTGGLLLTTYLSSIEEITFECLKNICPFVQCVSGIWTSLTWLWWLTNFR